MICDFRLWVYEYIISNSTFSHPSNVQISIKTINLHISAYAEILSLE